MLSGVFWYGEHCRYPFCTATAVVLWAWGRASLSRVTSLHATDTASYRFCGYGYPFHAPESWKHFLHLLVFYIFCFRRICGRIQGPHHQEKWMGRSAVSRIFWWRRCHRVHIFDQEEQPVAVVSWKLRFWPGCRTWWRCVSRLLIDESDLCVVSAVVRKEKSVRLLPDASLMGLSIHNFVSYH